MLRDGDALMLCTDGLIEPAEAGNKLSLADLHPALVSGETPEAKVHELMSGALGHGGRDNIACVFAQF